VKHTWQENTFRKWIYLQF